MRAYSDDQERAVRLLHTLRDWRESQLISDEQHVRMAADLETGLRRTNVFLRGTLFVLTGVITLAAVGLLAITIEPDEWAIGILVAVAGGVAFAGAAFLIDRYRLYRFGIEEALAAACVLFAGGAVGLLLERVQSISGETAMGLAFIAAAIAAFAVFFQFGFVHAAIVAMGCAALAPFPLLQSDIMSRSIAMAVLAAMFLAARLQRSEYGEEFPGDNYAVVETAAWGGMYFVLNLKISAWLAHPAESGPFYWITYVLIWMLPVAGLWIAVRERHRLLLDLNIMLAIATMMSNKPYLGAEQKPWDPIGFGLMLVTVALGLRRWLSSGAGGARSGFVAFRLLASERERLSTIGSVSVMQPSLHPQHGPDEAKPGFGGGRSGGGGDSANF